MALGRWRSNPSLYVRVESKLDGMFFGKLSPMKTKILYLLLLPLSALCQKPAPINQRAKADSVLSYFLGEENFKRHIKLDLKKSDHSLFNYIFSHPKLSGRTFVITLRFDSAGQFTSTGLIRIDSLSDWSWISGEQALTISNSQKKSRIAATFFLKNIRLIFFAK